MRAGKIFIVNMYYTERPMHICISSVDENVAVTVTVSCRAGISTKLNIYLVLAIKLSMHNSRHIPKTSPPSTCMLIHPTNILPRPVKHSPTSITLLASFTDQHFSSVDSFQTS